MSVRTDLESRLNTWAVAQNPPIEVAWEGISYNKPTSQIFLQPILMPATPRMAGINGVRYRELGVFHINVWGIDGEGSAETDTIANSLVNLFPVIPKFADTSIERVGYAGQAEIINGYRVVPVTFYYRRETQTI